uniref:Uncharacterized protein n=1 Tax=Anguilla anguilla TaxID=7936 RepID=A0A0E9WM97_ANGAN
MQLKWQQRDIRFRIFFSFYFNLLHIAKQHVLSLQEISLDINAESHRKKRNRRIGFLITFIL